MVGQLFVFLTENVNFRTFFYGKKAANSSKIIFFFSNTTDINVMKFSDNVEPICGV